MKKLIALITAVAIAVPCCYITANQISKHYQITENEAIDFINDVREIQKKDYDKECRLFVSSKKSIDKMGAVDIVFGMKDAYLLQYKNKTDTNRAYEYYNSLPYVEFAEYDYVENAELCSDIEEENPTEPVGDNSLPDFPADCISTILPNIDDAIKLLKKEQIKFPKITVGVIDTGVALVGNVADRFDGGCTIFEDYNENGTDDLYNHGTVVSSVIARNTLDNVRIRSYQILSKDKETNMSLAYAQIMLAIAQDCRIMNISIKFTHHGNLFQKIGDYAEEMNVIMVCSGGNDHQNISFNSLRFPARFKNFITVGGVDLCGAMYASSNYGEAMDIYAPATGVNVYRNTGEPSQSGGTSVAAPIICAISSLLIALKPDITYHEIEQLLQSTGNALYEDCDTSAHRVAADAYAAVSKLLGGAKLEKCHLEYFVTKNSETNSSTISFASDDNAKIYYSITKDNKIYYPFKEFDNYFPKYYLYKGENVTLDNEYKITAQAYAPGKEKSELEIFCAPKFTENESYKSTQASGNNKYNSITYCNLLNEKTIEVPTEIAANEIQEIGDRCFAGNKEVETIILPESVKRIGNYAFTNCKNLKTVIAPGVTECGYFAFYNCKNLKFVSLPYLSTANTGLFKNCVSLESVDCKPLSMICNQSFYGCQNLKVLKTENTDFEFCSNTFFNCRNLQIFADENSYMYKFAKENNIHVITDKNLVPNIKCNHPQLKIIQRLEKDCFNEGYSVFYCTLCGCAFTDMDYCTGHDYQITKVEKTCCEYEKAKYECRRCGYAYIETVGWTLKPHDTYTKEYLAPTESKTGRAYTYCKNCSTVLPNTIIPSLAPYEVKGCTIVAEDRNFNAPNKYPLSNVSIYVDGTLSGRTDEKGEFKMNFGNGTYEVHLTHPSSLDKSFTFTVNNGNVTIDEPIAMIACDWEKDGYINAKDFAKLKHADTIYGYDLNGDTYINAVEENIFKNCLSY